MGYHVQLQRHEDAEKLEVAVAGNIGAVRRSTLVGKLNGTPEKSVCEVAKGK